MPNGVQVVAVLASLFIAGVLICGGIAFWEGWRHNEPDGPPDKKVAKVCWGIATVFIFLAAWVVTR